MSRVESLPEREHPPITNDPCNFFRAWIGPCGKTPTHYGYCEDHIALHCCSCGAQSTHECPEASSLVCGYPLCDNCHHGDQKLNGKWHQPKPKALPVETRPTWKETREE